jgi:hypothetical protein
VSIEKQAQNSGLVGFCVFGDFGQFGWAIFCKVFQFVIEIVTHYQDEIFKSAESDFGFCFFDDREFHQGLISPGDDDFLSIQRPLDEFGELGLRLVGGNDHKVNLAK